MSLTTVEPQYSLARLPTPPDTLAEELRAGLTAAQKYLPCKWLYDEAGSNLFEQICDLPEYYLTRAESGILREQAPAIVAQCPTPLSLVELGSGSSRKTRHLIRALLLRQKQLTYYPIDISRAALDMAAAWMVRDFDRLRVVGINGEFDAGLRYLSRHSGLPRLVCFLGSTVGNFDEAELRDFLTRMRSHLRAEDRLLLGFDVLKDPAILVPAYDDARGVTSRFNLNMLARLNSAYGADFNLSAFAHRAVFNPDRSRMEMYLVSLRTQTVTVPGLDIVLEIAQGEAIHTENSYKHSERAMQDMLRQHGLDVQGAFRDAGRLFCLYLIR